MTANHLQFLNRANNAATEAAHIFPLFAACEAGLESGFGTSSLSIADNNLFGMKQHMHPIYGTHHLPTREFLDKHWVVVDASWIHYPTQRDCFIDRMNTLKRLAHAYPHYAAALAATTGEVFITEVSKSWSTDPERGQKVLNIYQEAFGANQAGTGNS